jgi:hypothetical protein
MFLICIEACSFLNCLAAAFIVFLAVIFGQVACALLPPYAVSLTGAASGITSAGARLQDDDFRDYFNEVDWDFWPSFIRADSAS